MNLSQRIASLSVKIAVIACMSVAISSCYSGVRDDVNRIENRADYKLDMTREEFRDNLIPQKTEREIRKEKSLEPAIPDISDILTTPQAPEEVPDKLISLSVTEEVPLKEVLIELSRLADVDMEIDPSISGGIILRVKDRPFKDVIERVVALGNLRYYIKGGVIRVERDRPYQVDYKVDFLNLVRDNTSTTTVDTKGLGDSENSSPAGSTSTITASSEGDVWQSIQKSIENMLTYKESISFGGGDSAATNLDEVIQINKPAGVISIIATDRQHETISSYLKKIQEQLSSQVLIEAKVVEVTLNDEFRSGIDWGTLSDVDGLGIQVSGNFKGGVSNSADFLTITGSSGKNLSTAVSLTEAFGTSRTLSSPRLHAMNNQQAVLSFAENSVYFQLDVVEETDTVGGEEVKTAKVTSELKTVPVGVILSLQPSINLETQEITMHVRPTISRITGTVEDPAVDIIVARQTVPDGQDPIDVVSEIPVIEVRELDSVLKIKSGEVMVIGGLMKDSTTTDDKGVPFMNRIPMFGNLFKSNVQTSTVTETIIFIKATIVPNRGVSKPDENIYRNFMPRDPRPLAF